MISCKYNDIINIANMKSEIIQSSKDEGKKSNEFKA